MHVFRRCAVGAILLLVSSPILFLFQNCTAGFQVDSAKLASMQGASGHVDPSLVFLETVPTLTSQKSVAIKIKSTVDPQLKIKSLSCNLNGVETACPDPLVLTGLADGNYALSISLTDSSGASAKISTAWMVDATKPEVLVNQKPGTLSGADMNIDFTARDSGSGVAKTECSLDAEVFAACVSPIKKTLTAGPHRFRIQTTDRAGNVSDLSDTNWTVDLSAPVITISRSPNGFSKQTTETFEFQATAPNTTITKFTCELDNVAATSCVTGQTFADIKEGRRTFTVTALNSLNGLKSSLSVSWTADFTRPTLPVITTTTAKFMKLTTASFSFQSSDAGSGVASYQCRYDSIDLGNCTAPRAIDVGSAGPHSFYVTATDNVGNVSDAARFDWTVDQIAPTVSIAGLEMGAIEMSPIANFLRPTTRRRFPVISARPTTALSTRVRARQTWAADSWRS